MRIPPKSVQLGWPLPNYTDPVTHGPAILVVNIIFITLVLIAFIGRFYSRIFIKKWLGIDDAMCVPALVFTIATTIIVILANVEYGWERHLWDLPLDKIQVANVIAFIAKLTFTFAATFIRLSFICFYYRLVKDSGIKWFNWVLHVSVAWTLAVCIFFIALTIWLCDPIEYYWKFPPPVHGHCLDEGKVMLGGGVVNSVSDLLTTVLPIPIVMRLQMPLKQRIGVCILLSLGFIVTIAGSVRTYYTWKSLMHSWDETWWAYPLWIAAAVELDLGLICSCAPAWKSLLQQPLKDLSSKLSSLRSPSTSPNSSRSAKPGIFNPLRSLPWFQITRLDFERTQQESDEYPLQEIEKGEDRTVEVLSEGRHKPAEHDVGARSFQFSDIVAESSRPATSALEITRRQSLDQSSAHVGESWGLSGEWSSDTTLKASRSVC